MSNQFRGVGVHFGLKDQSMSGSGFTVNGTFTSRDYSRKTNKAVATDGDGAELAAVYYNPTEDAKLSYVITGSNSGSSSINIGVNDIPFNGMFATVLSPTFSPLSGSTWTVEDVTVKSTNTSITVVDVDLHRAPGIVS